VAAGELMNTGSLEPRAVDRGPVGVVSESAQGLTVPGFSLALERFGSESAVLVLAGELDLFRAPAIEDALAGVPRITVDLRLVTFIDAVTLTVLLKASRSKQHHGGRLLVLVGPQTPMTAFEATGVDRLLELRRVDDEPSHHSMHANQRRDSPSPLPPTTPKRRIRDGNT